MKMIRLIATLSLFLAACVAFGQKASPLTVTASPDKAAYMKGETVTVKITLKNSSAAPMKINFPSGQRFDLVVKKSGAAPTAKPIWRWSDGRMFTMAYSTVTFDPGQAQAFTGTWDQKDSASKPVPPGTYDVFATIASEQTSGLTPVRVTVRIGQQAGLMKRIDVRGKIVRIVPRASTAPADNLGTIVVEGKKTADTNNDKAVVTVTSTTRIWLIKGNKRVAGKMSDLKVGRTVEVWFSGPALLSYPVQAGAGVIYIK